MKKMKIALSILTVVFTLQSAKAQQYPNDGQYQSIAPPPTPAMPNYGQSVMDNSVPTSIEITRITEAQGNWYPTHEYAKTQVWNIDQTKYKVASWKVYNAATYVEEQTLASMYPSYWSNTDPDVIWSFRVNGDIKKYNVSTNTAQTVANIPGYEFVKLGPGEANIDKNDHYVALVGKKANLDLDVIVFDLQTNQIVSTTTFANGWGNGPDYAPQFIDWVSVSQSGDYVVVLWSNGSADDINTFYLDQNNNNHYGVEVYNRATMTIQYQNRIADGGNHGDLGYAVDGDEVFVQYKAGSAGVYMQKLNGTGETQVNNTTEITASGHISCRNINRPGWAYISQATSANPSSKQIVAVKLDTSGIVEHFGHHFSSDISYDQSPMAVASPNGDKICFHSDFETSPNDGNVVYSFFATINSVMSVEDEQLADMNLYPNPANDFITIQGVDEIKNIKIYNNLGQIVKNIDFNNTNNASVNLINFSKGIYFVRISNDTNYVIKKIIKE